MAKICFKNILEENGKFENTDEEYLLAAIHEYAADKDDDIYKSIMSEKVAIYINNEFLEVDKWNYKLKEDDEIVIIPSLHGSLVAIGIGSALMWLGVEIGITGMLAAVGTTLFAIGLSLALGGLSNLLFTPDLPKSSTRTGGTETQTYNWSGIKTTAKADTPLSIVYGTHKLGGNVISLFTDNDGNDSYLYMLLGLCEGEIDGICAEDDYTQVCSTSDSESASYKNPAIYFDDQPLRNYSEVTWWYRKGTNLPDSSEDEFCPTVQNKIPYFDGAIIQYDDGREVLDTGTVYTTTKEIDMLKVQLESPALYRANPDTGSIDPYSFSYKIEWKKVGGTYADWDIKKYTPSVTATSGSNANYCVGTRYEDNTTFKLGDKKPSYKIKVIENGYSKIYQAYKDAAAVNEYAFYVYISGVDYDITLDLYDASDNFIERKTLKCSCKPNMTTYTTLLTSIVPSFTLGDYIVAMSHNCVVGEFYTIASTLDGTVSTVTITGKSKSSVWESVNLDFRDLSDGKAQYDIKISRTDGGSSQALSAENTLKLHSVSEIIQGNFIYPNTTLLGFKIRATDQLSGSPPNVNVIVRGKKIKVPDLEDASPSGTNVTFDDCFWDNVQERWENSSGTEVFWNDTSSWRKEYSENSLCCVRDVMLNKRYGLGEYIDSSDLNKTGIISSIRSCHKTYNPYSTNDYFSWWDSGTDSYWSNKWYVDSKFPTDDVSLTQSNSSRYIDVSGSTGKERISVVVTPKSSLLKNQTYSLDVKLDNVTKTITSLTVYGISNSLEEYLNIQSNITADNTYTISLTPKTTISDLRLEFICDTGISFRFSNVSMTRSSNEHYHTYNGVLESDQSAITALLEMCDSFRCWPVYYNGLFNFIIDEDKTISQTLSFGNTVKFTQSFTPISDIPYRLIGQYTDESIGFNMRSITTKASSKDLNKLNENTIGLKGLTSFHKAARELKWKMSIAETCTHNIELECGLDAIHSTAGEVIAVQDPLPSWGQGGRLLDYTSTHLTIDSKYTFTNAATDTHLIKWQDKENSFHIATVNNTNITSNASLLVIPVKSFSASPCTDSVYALGKSTSYIKKFRLVSVNRSDSENVTIQAREHISSLYTEPTLEYVSVVESGLPNVLEKPKEPLGVKISATSESEGVGFNIGVTIDSNDSVSREIVVQMDRTNSFYFETILVVPITQNQIKYINNSLKLDNTYSFRIFCRSQFKSSSYIEVSYKLYKGMYKLPAPSGLSIKDSNSNSFAGKDVTVVWNPTGSSTQTISTTGYKVVIYHTSPNTDSYILRTEYVSDNKFTYTLEMNEEDCSRNACTSDRYATVYFRIYTLGSNSTLSDSTTPFIATNTTPSVLTGLTTNYIVGGVQFVWTKSVALDHKYYKYQSKVATAAWGSWSNIEDSTVNRLLTSSEISTHSSRATIRLKVKDIDWYEQESTVASTNASANIISDNIYQLISSASGGYTGNVASLIDGTRDRGGVIIL